MPYHGLPYGPFYTYQRRALPHLPSGFGGLPVPQLYKHHAAGQRAGVLHAHRGPVPLPGKAGAEVFPYKAPIAAAAPLLLLVFGLRPVEPPGLRQLRQPLRFYLLLRPGPLPPVVSHGHGALLPLSPGGPRRHPPGRPAHRLSALPLFRRVHTLCKLQPHPGHRPHTLPYNPELLLRLPALSGLRRLGLLAQSPGIQKVWLLIAPAVFLPSPYSPPGATSGTPTTSRWPTAGSSAISPCPALSRPP